MVRFEFGRDDYEVELLTTFVTRMLCMAVVPRWLFFLSFKQIQVQRGVCCFLLLYYFILVVVVWKFHLLSFKLVNFMWTINKRIYLLQLFFRRKGPHSAFVFRGSSLQCCTQTGRGASFHAGCLQALAKLTASSLVFLTLIKLLMLLTS